MSYRGSSGSGTHSGTADQGSSADAYRNPHPPAQEEAIPATGGGTPGVSPEMQALITETADALQVSPRELAAIISFETGGSMNPLQPGPTTKWGQHKGLIQFGEPQAQQYGVDFTNAETALRSQLGKDGAIVKYALGTGFTPGEHNELNLYAAINAGDPTATGAKDEAAGGTPGSVADKYYNQMMPHRDKFTSTEWRNSGTKTADAGIPEGGDQRTAGEKRADGWATFAEAMAAPTAHGSITKPITNAQSGMVEMLQLDDMAIPEY